MNRFRVNGNGASPQEAAAGSRNLGYESDFYRNSDSLSSSTLGPPEQSAAVQRTMIRPEGEMPLLHRGQNNGRQGSQLTRLLNGANGHANPRQVSQLTILLNQANARSNSTRPRSFTMNALSNMHEQAVVEIQRPISSSLEVTSHLDNDSHSLYSPFSTSPPIPLQRAMQQTNNVIVEPPPSSSRRRESSYLQTLSLNNLIRQGGNTQTDPVDIITSPRQAHIFHSSLESFSSEAFSPSDYLSQPPGAQTDIGPQR